MAKDFKQPYGGNNGYRGNSGYGNREQQMLPNGYLQELKQGYYAWDGNDDVLKKEFIIAYPREIAQTLSNEGRNVNKRSQIRKFYEFVLRIQALMHRRDSDFAVLEPELARLIPYVAYAKSRGTVTMNFVKFIEGNVAAVKTADDLNAFVKHFESVIAFLPKDN